MLIFIDEFVIYAKLFEKYKIKICVKNIFFSNKIPHMIKLKIQLPRHYGQAL